MTLEQLYRLFPSDTPDGEDARMLLAQMHWFSIIAELDPRTAEALPQTISAVLGEKARQGQDTAATVLRDRLWRITEHARPSLEKLFRALNESPKREHAFLPIRAVRELDTASFMALSRRPGRNVREKLAGKPYMQAVRRFQSIDLPENRLLKAFAERLAELLELREEYLGETPDELLDKIRSWLVTDEALAIRRWDNLPPNNTLLSHRHYRAVYDAWRWLQTLDEDIARDLSQLHAREETKKKWSEYGRMYAECNSLFAEMPVLFDYEEFEIRPWVGRPIFINQKISRGFPTVQILEPVCIDLASLHPRYATMLNHGTHGTSRKEIPCTFLWQQWKNAEETVDIELFSADAAYLHSDATTVSAPDLFFSKVHSREHLDRAARSFAGKLRDTFRDDTLIWLVPDFTNDFELEIIRRNLNARFPNAEPLPRSVAAVFEKVDYARLRDGYSVVVCDSIGGQQCATKLEARFDQELEKRIPDTYGFYWERHPPVIVSHGEGAKNTEAQQLDIVTVDGNGNWHDAQPEPRPTYIDQNTLRRDKRIGQFAFLINLSESPVCGGIRLHALQQRAGDIPLWRDQIPELSIKASVNRVYQRFYLVSRGTTIKPIRGQSVQIPVEKIFKLPAGIRPYQFPLVIGEKAEEIGFSAKLESPAFPLKTELQCRLNMTFTYGADDCYRLIFEPLDNSVPPILAKWQKTVEEVVTDATAPEYPQVLSWSDLTSVPKPGSGGRNDMLEWASREIDSFSSLRERMVGEICDDWHMGENNKHYTRVKCDEDSVSVFIHENHFVAGMNYEDFSRGDKLSFVRHEHNGKITGWLISAPDCDVTSDWIKIIRRRLYVPFIHVWRDGRSITDNECPKTFVSALENRIEAFAALQKQPKIPQRVKYEILFLLACLHKDTTDDCIQWLIEQVEKNNIRNPRAVGFALGDVSQEWQQHIFHRLSSQPSFDAISVFAYAIWREQHFVERFSFLDLQKVLDKLSQRLTNMGELNAEERKDATTKWNWMHAVVETFEFLLGLLRTRNSADPEIKMLLQPHQKITKELSRQVERITELVMQSKIDLFSRIQLNIQKPERDRTPDLLYALRLYLTGDNGANAIHITGVSDGEND